MMLRKALIGLGLCAGLAFATAARSQAPNLTALHDALHLTPAQESAWSTYQALIPAPADAQSRHQAAASLFRTLPAPRRIDLVQAEMEQDLADVHRQALALKSFYATLDADQQHTFDTMTLPPANSGEDEQ
jgi:hypothetical protein